MKLQEVFDIAVNGVIEQGRPSRTRDKACRLRGPHGAKCAVGFLISDEFYDPILEEYANPRVFSKSREAIQKSYPGVPASAWALLEKLQIAHDDNAPFEFKDFTNRFRRDVQLIAKKFELEGPA